MEKLTKELTGKTALVTGGTKGIGKAIADELASLGVTVITSARHEPAEKLPYHFIQADVTNSDSISELAGQVTKGVLKIVTSFEFLTLAQQEKTL